MLVTSHKNGTIPSAGKGAVCKCIILKMHMPKIYLLHNLYKCPLIIMTIIFKKSLYIWV